MKCYRVAIIGCGRIAGWLEDDSLREHPCTHVGAYHAHRKCKVVACLSSEIEDSKKFAKRFNIPSYYDDIDRLFDNEKIDILSIATYASSHAEITIKAAYKGVKAIFCEKAMATNLSEAERMIDACKENSVVLSINYTRRWSRDFIYAKKLIDSGKLGKIQTMTGYFSGNIIHTGTHMFDAMLFLAGKAVSVEGNLSDSANIENSGYKFERSNDELKDCDGIVNVNFKNGVIANAIGLGKRYFIFELDIHGSEGRIRIGNGLFEFWKRKKSKFYEGFHDLHLQPLNMSSGKTSLENAIYDIVRAIESKHKRWTNSSGGSAKESLEIAFAAYMSHCNNKIINLPLINCGLTVESR